MVCLLAHAPGRLRGGAPQAHRTARCAAGPPSTVGCNKTGVTDINLKWNYYSSEWGGYTVDGCVGVNPNLMIAAGKTYKFHQSDITNW